MPFNYRLQKILDFRIRKKEEQLLEVQRAQKALFEAEENIRRNNEEIEQTKINQRTASYLLMESYDLYLHHLWEKGDQLELVRQEAELKLQEEYEKLIELEKGVKVLEKHKEKQKEVYLAEEKSAELKKLSEIAVQRHFRQTGENLEEELLEELKSIEREYSDEY